MADVTVGEALPEFDERALVERAQQGDAEALSELYERYLPRVYRFVAARLRRAEDVEDVTEEVFLKVIDNLGRYRWRGLPFGAWIFRIARNEVVTFIRRQKLREHTDPLDDRIRDSESGQAVRIEERDRMEAVRAAIGQLPPAQREVIELRFVAGLSVAETAKVLGKSENNVKVLQHKGIARLQRLLKEWR